MHNIIALWPENEKRTFPAQKYLLSQTKTRADY